MATDAAPDIQGAVAETESRLMVLIRQLQGSAPTTVTGTLLSGWSVYTTLRWWLTNGIAHIDGELNVGTTAAGTHIWALQPAIVPQQRYYAFGQMGGTGSTGQAAAVQVTTTGFLQVSDEAALGAGTVLHLPHFTFPVF